MKVNTDILNQVLKNEKLIALLPQDHKEIIALIVKKNGEIRASKPKVSKENPVTGRAAYVWRMVVFLVSKKRAHQCMPMCADFDLPAFNDQGEWKCEIARTMQKELKVLEDLIIECVPKAEWHGVNRWAQVL